MKKKVSIKKFIKDITKKTRNKLKLYTCHLFLKSKDNAEFLAILKFRFLYAKMMVSQLLYPKTVTESSEKFIKINVKMSDIRKQDFFKFYK